MGSAVAAWSPLVPRKDIARVGGFVVHSVMVAEGLRF